MECRGRGEFKTTTASVFIDRYTFLREQTRELLQKHPDAYVSAEYSVFGETYSEGMFGVYLYLCEALRMERRRVVFWSPLHLKAQARVHLGRPPKWKMTKPDMIEAAKLRSNQKSPVWSEHQADAFWAAHTGLTFWRFYQGDLVEDELTTLDREQLIDIRTDQHGATKFCGTFFKEGKRYFLWDRDGEERRNGVEG